jgi:hypothetical protein
VPVDVELSQFTDGGDGLRAVGERFDEEHTRLFTFALDAEHELVNLRAVVHGVAPTVSAPTLPRGDSRPDFRKHGPGHLPDPRNHFRKHEPPSGADTHTARGALRPGPHRLRRDAGGGADR